MSPNESRSRQEVVESLLRRIVQRPEFPVFAEHIAQVMRVVEDDETSLRHITNVVLKDFSLTLKILRTANSPYYNRSGKGIVTITHAVALLGLEAIRDLAGGLLLFEHFQRKSPGLRELMLLSLLTASHARVAAEHIDYPRIEEAYLCGMFRNLGEVLVAGYLPRKYAAVLGRMKEFSLSEHAACLQVLGCGYEDLGRSAARFWKMPDRVRQCMRTEQPRITKALHGEMDVLMALTSFSHGLTEAVHRREPSAVQARLNYLLMTHGPILSLARNEIHEISEKAIDETKATFDMLRMPVDDLRLRRQAESAMKAMKDEEDDAEEAPVTDMEPGEKLLERLIEEVELVLCSGHTPDLTKVILMILEAMYRGIDLYRATFALVTPDHLTVRGRLGLGEDVNRFIEGFSFPLSIRSGPIAVALLGKQDLFVNENRYQDSEFGRLVNSTRFGLLPVVVDGVAVGCFLAECKPDAPKFSDQVLYLLSRLRALAAEAVVAARSTGALTV